MLLVSTEYFFIPFNIFSPYTHRGCLFSEELRRKKFTCYFCADKCYPTWSCAPVHIFQRVFLQFKFGKRGNDKRLIDINPSSDFSLFFPFLFFFSFSKSHEYRLSVKSRHLSRRSVKPCEFRVSMGNAKLPRPFTILRAFGRRVFFRISGNTDALY